MSTSKLPYSDSGTGGAPRVVGGPDAPVGPPESKIRISEGVALEGWLACAARVPCDWGRTMAARMEAKYWGRTLACEGPHDNPVREPVMPQGRASYALCRAHVALWNRWARKAAW